MKKKKSTKKINRIDKLLKPVSVSVSENISKEVKPEIKAGFKSKENLEQEVGQGSDLNDRLNDFRFFSFKDNHNVVRGEGVRRRDRLDENFEIASVRTDGEAKDDKTVYRPVNVQNYISDLPTIRTERQKNYVVMQRNLVETDRKTWNVTPGTNARENAAEAKPFWMTPTTTGSWGVGSGNARDNYEEMIVHPEDYVEVKEDKEDRRERVRRR